MLCPGSQDFGSHMQSCENPGSYEGGTVWLVAIESGLEFQVLERSCDVVGDSVASFLVELHVFYFRAYGYGLPLYISLEDFLTEFKYQTIVNQPHT